MAAKITKGRKRPERSFTERRLGFKLITVITPQQFLEAFLQEKAAAYAETNVRLSSIHRKYFGAPVLEDAGAFLLRDPSKAVTEDVKQSNGSAIVITREPVLNTILRERYHLSADGESWKIIRMDRQCFACRGTGRFEESACSQCEGEGWIHRPGKPSDVGERS